MPYPNEHSDTFEPASGGKNKMNYYTIRNQADDEGSAEILLYGDIGDSLWSEGTGAKQFAEDLKKCGKVKNLDIRINSPGGSVFEGLAIYNTLERHSAKKIVTIDGLAASIASVIAMAGDTVVMPENSVMMIHDPLALTIGSAEDHRKMAEGLDKIKTGLISAYAKKTKMSNQDIADLMSEETWMTANEAVEWGFADEVAEPMRMAASLNFDLSAYKKAPKNIFSRSKDELVIAAATGSQVTEPITIKQGGKTMETCKVCGVTLVEGRCPGCYARVQAVEAEKVRAKEILEVGNQFSLIPDAVKAVQDGKTIEEFRIFAMAELQKRIVPIGPLDRVEPQPKDHKLFKSFGEQMVAVFNAGIPGGKIDPKLHILNATGLGTAIPSESGFLVQTDFSLALLQRAQEQAVLASKCWHVPIGPDADGVEMPTIDETSRATGSRWGGVQVYRRAEAATVTAKKPKFGSFELRLEDMMGLCYTTNRMLKDAASAGAIISRSFEEEFSFKLDDEIVRGTGVGECLGILNSAALVTVTKETGQAADTIVTENIIKIFARMRARNRVKAEWYYNQEIEPQLFTMGIIVGMGGTPIYMPPGGLSVSPYGTLLGRPMIPIEQASALGDVGDIIFADLNDYMIIEKGGLEATSSMHVLFIYDEMCFKFILRNNGGPIWKSALTPYKGTGTLSPFVTLGAR